MTEAATRTPFPAKGLPLSPDPLEPLPLLRRELGTGPSGLSAREAARRLAVYGPNEVRRKARTSLGRELVRQLVHPLAMLLWAAAVLAFVADIAVLGWAIVAVVVVNAAFALLQERQAEQAKVVALIATFPVLVWGTDALRRWLRRTRRSRNA